MPAVRTTIQPHTLIDVDDAELLDLKRQGLLIEEPAAAPAAAPAKTHTAAKGKES